MIIFSGNCSIVQNNVNIKLSFVYWNLIEKFISVFCILRTCNFYLSVLITESWNVLQNLKYVKAEM